MDKVDRPRVANLDKMLYYLDELRESGVTNMYGAAPWIGNAFGISLDDARDALLYWMDIDAQRRAVPDCLTALVAIIADHDERLEIYPDTEVQPNRVKVMQDGRAAIAKATGETPLIAAAPDLLAALTEVLRADNSMEENFARSSARKAIAKATGETP